MRKRFNFRVDFLSLPKASWGTSCTQHGPARRRKSDPGGAPGPPRSVPGATPEAVWSQKAARNHPDPLETPILGAFWRRFCIIFVDFCDPKVVPRTFQMTIRKLFPHANYWQHVATCFVSSTQVHVDIWWPEIRSKAGQGRSLKSTQSRNHFIRHPILNLFPTISTSKPSNRKATKLDID